jgi:hypothetical protein
MTKTHGVQMISRKSLKTEIDKVRSEYLELLYGIIKLLENGAREKVMSAPPQARAPEAGHRLDWHDFIASTYGCLADAPIAREEQGRHERREAME